MNISLTNNPPCTELAPWHVQVTPDGNYIHATIDLQSSTSKPQMGAVFVVNIALCSIKFDIRNCTFMHYHFY